MTLQVYSFLDAQRDSVVLHSVQEAQAALIVHLQSSGTSTGLVGKRKMMWVREPLDFRLRRNLSMCHCICLNMIHDWVSIPYVLSCQHRSGLLPIRAKTVNLCHIYIVCHIAFWLDVFAFGVSTV